MDQGTILEFHKLYPSPRVYLCGMDFKTAVTPQVTNEHSLITINQMHEMLGHPDERVKIKTASHQGITLQCQMNPCTACALAKAKQRNISKLNVSRSDQPGQIIYLDLSYTRNPSLGGAHYWLLIADECTGIKWSEFLKNKDALAKEVFKVITKKKLDKSVNFIRCDNAGENKNILEELNKQKIEDVTIEYTSP